MHLKTLILNLGRLTSVVPILHNGGISCFRTEAFTLYMMV